MSFTRTFTAGPEHIDELGHVNNAVWVQWMEAIATGHWEAHALPEQVARYIWVVTRHEIDYRGNIGPGDTVTATSWIPEPPKGARFDRMISFTDASGKEVVRSRSTWAIIERESGKLVRVPKDVAERFGPYGER